MPGIETVLGGGFQTDADVVSLVRQAHQRRPVEWRLQRRVIFVRRYSITVKRFEIIEHIELGPGPAAPSCSVDFGLGDAAVPAQMCDQLLSVADQVVVVVACQQYGV